MHQRLVMQPKIVVLHCLPDTSHPMEVPAHALALLGSDVVGPDTISAIRLCSLARHVSLSDHLVTPESRRGDQRDSNAALKVEDMPLFGMTQTAHLRKNLTCNRFCLGARYVPHQNDKLITAKPC